MRRHSVLFSGTVRYLLLLACLLSIRAITRPQGESARNTPHSWKAFWITSPEAPKRDECVLRFRKQLTLQMVPKSYKIHVSADNQFLLQVNGTFIGTGPSHSDLEHWKYETYDPSPVLHAGVNYIVATVWNFGIDSPQRQITDRIGFLVDSDSSDKDALRSDSTWDVAIDTGVSTLPIPISLRKGPYFAAPGELVDGRALLQDFSSQQMIDSRRNAWKKATYSLDRRPNEALYLRGLIGSLFQTSFQIWSEVSNKRAL